MQMVLAERIRRKHPAYYAINFDATVREVAGMMADKNIGAILVEMPAHEEGVFAGIVSERDIIRCCVEYDDLASLPLSEIMQKEMIVANVSDDVEQTVVKMRKHHIRHIPLRDNDKIIALISIRDLMYCVDMEKEILLRHMSDFVGSSRYNTNF